MSQGQPFRALVVHREGDQLRAEVQRVDDASLPEGDVTVAVDYSTVNYKDGLALKGLGGVVKTWPHVPGVDLAGIVESSASDAFRPGEPVILTGWRVGEIRWGGFAEKARVHSEWLVPLPNGLTTRRAMAFGTAGLTAMLAVEELERHGAVPGQEILVTGATGGVGSVAVAVLACLGYRVVASTGKESEHAYLRELGAAEIVPRDALAKQPTRPLSSERWHGAIDSVGGTTLASILPQIRHGGSVAACGLVAGAELTTTVIPFLLRGVRLLGIESTMHAIVGRQRAWSRLAEILPATVIDSMIDEIPLAEVPAAGEKILRGGVKGRIVVDVRR